jgi:hypothetical protein
MYIYIYIDIYIDIKREREIRGLKFSFLTQFMLFHQSLNVYVAISYFTNSLAVLCQVHVNYATYLCKCLPFIFQTTLASGLNGFLKYLTSCTYYDGLLPSTAFSITDYFLLNAVGVILLTDTSLLCPVVYSVKCSKFYRLSKSHVFVNNTDHLHNAGIPKERPRKQ